MIKQIKDILLNHKGKKNRITSSAIAAAIGIVENATYAKTRSLILECAKTYKLPLAADTKGYYLITSQKEYNDYISNLNSRIAGIEDRKRIITENFEEWKRTNEIHTEE